MRQLTPPFSLVQSKHSRTFLLLLSGCCLSLSLLTSPVSAQNAQQGSQGTGNREQGTVQSTIENRKSKIENSPTPSQELPLLLLVVQRPQGTPAKKDDMNTALSLMLRASVRESRKYQVILYSAEHPSIRRVLLEHAIAASELAEPIAPEALQKLAKLIGAHDILMVSSALEKSGLRTDVRLMTDAGADTWITPLAQPFIVDAQLGKLRLKNEQMLALTVDDIDKYLGVPSHLASNLTKTIIIGKTDPKKNKNAKNSKNANNPKTKSGDNSEDDARTAKNGSASEDGGDSANGGKPTDPATGNTNGVNGTSGRITRAADKTQAAEKTQAERANGNSAGNNSAGNTSGNNTGNAPANRSADNNNTGNDTSADTDAQTAKTSATGKSTPRKTNKPSVKIARNTQKSRGNSDTTATPNTAGEVGNAGAANGSGNGAGTQGAASEANPAALQRVTSDNLKNKPEDRKNQPAILDTDAGASLLAEPNIIPPVPPTDKIDYEAAADRYRKTGDLSNAINSLRQAINENPRALNLRKKLIIAYQDRLLPDLAASEIERALVLAPGDADLTKLRASTLFGKGDTTNAIKMLRDVVAAHPGDTSGQVALGDALLADGQFADALSAFETAAKNDPKSPLPHRRLARVLAARAGSDITQYAACLGQIEQARKLTPTTDTQTYQGDYFELMLLLETRLKDMLDQVNETSMGVGKRANADLMQHATDLKERAEAASDFLDKLPPAAGQDVTHAHYGQGAALLVQSIGYLRKFIPSNEAQIGNSLRATRIDALTELTNAHDRLIASREVLEKGRAATGVSGN